MGQVGYWIFNIANVITLFGMAMGTMVRFGTHFLTF